MKQAKSRPAPKARCSSCRKLTPKYDTVESGSLEEGYRILCGQCSNAEVARVKGVNFEHLNFEPVQLVDVAGHEHEFHFRAILSGGFVTLEAFELREGSPSGYYFQLVGNSEWDLLVLLGKLIDKMRRALAVTHLQNGQHGLRIRDTVVRGRFEPDQPGVAGMPRLVIDGRDVSWQQFGELLMRFEGCQFKMELGDLCGEM